MVPPDAEPPLPPDPLDPPLPASLQLARLTKMTQERRR
jgi:hypothetical protein